MAYADPIVILVVALAASWVGWPPPKADLRAALRRLIRSAARGAPSEGGAAAAVGLGLAALGALVGAAVVWIAVAQVAFVLRALLPFQAALAVEIGISALLLALTLDPPLTLRSRRGEAPQSAEPAGLRWTRGVVTPLLLYALAGLYAAVAYRSALEAWKALQAEPSAEGPARWAERAVALVHYLPARLGALAACVVRGRAAWGRLQAAQPTSDPWRREWLAAAFEGTPARVVGATGVLLAFCLLILRW